MTMTFESAIHSLPARRPADRTRQAAILPPAAPSILPAAVRALERIESEAWKDLYSGAPQGIRAAAGLGLEPLGGLLAASAAACDAPAFNRVIARDPRVPIDGETLDRLIAHYRALGVNRAVLPWPPPPPGARTWWELDRRGIRPHNRWVKLWRDASPAPPVASALASAPLGAGERGAFEEVLAAGFDWPRSIAALWASLVGRPGWRHFAARRDGRVVAVAGLLIRGAAAWFGPAATLPGDRGRGAQTLLLRERIETARAAGCRLLAVETAEPTPEREVVSLRNVRRMGFEIAYRRENYLIAL